MARHRRERADVDADNVKALVSCVDELIDMTTQLANGARGARANHVHLNPDWVDTVIMGTLAEVRQRLIECGYYEK